MYFKTTAINNTELWHCVSQKGKFYDYNTGIKIEDRGKTALVGTASYSNEAGIDRYRSYF